MIYLFWVGQGCIPCVMDVVFYVCIVTRRAVGARTWEYEYFVMLMLYVCVLCASCGSSQCCILHDLQFVNGGQGSKRLPYVRDILQSRSLFLLPHTVVVNAFMMCSGLCACTKML